MMPPGSMQPVFPPAQETDTPDTEAQVNAAAAVKSRAAYLAGLNQEPEFHAHVLDGWLKEQEDGALSRLSSCPTVDVIEERAAWRAIQSMRQKLLNELQSASILVKAT